MRGNIDVNRGGNLKIATLRATSSKDEVLVALDQMALESTQVQKVPQATF